MNSPMTLNKSNELNAVETILIENIYSILSKREALVRIITENADSDYKKVIEAAHELKYIDGYKSTLNSLIEQFFEHAEAETLAKIADGDGFTPLYSFQSQVIIDKRVLKSFRYGQEYRAHQPKSAIAKKLGAKIIA